MVWRGLKSLNFARDEFEGEEEYFNSKSFLALVNQKEEVVVPPLTGSWGKVKSTFFGVFSSFTGRLWSEACNEFSAVDMFSFLETFLVLWTKISPKFGFLACFKLSFVTCLFVS